MMCSSSRALKHSDAGHFCAEHDDVAQAGVNLNSVAVDVLEAQTGEYSVFLHAL